jgi:putative peptidoglycan lipid II flippase
MQGTLRRGLRMVLFLTIPSTVGLALLGVPIVRLIYQHGRFSPHATFETANALSGYAVGLVAYAAIKVIAPAFYALGRTRVPLVASVLAVAANLLWNMTTFRRFGHVGLALGTSIAALVNVSVLALSFQRSVHGLFTRDLVVPFFKILGAAAVMAAAVGAATHYLELMPGKGVSIFAVKAFVPIFVGMAVYFGAARALKIEEAVALLRRVRR